MKVVDDLKNKIETAEKSGKRYSAFVTLFNKATGAKKLFPAIDAESALALPNSKWSKNPISVDATVSALAALMPEAPAEDKPEEASAEPEKTYPKRNRKISLDSQE